MLTYGYAITGSFCTFEKSIKQIEKLVNDGINIVPIMSRNAFETDTRFGKASDFRRRIETLCGKKIISSIEEAEPIGPKKLLDLLIISPCSGNTLAKLACGIYDTPVTLAAKAHLRNAGPVLIGVSTNDALSGSAKNIGTLMNYRHCYFIPMKQDDPQKKPRSVVCDFDYTAEAAKEALAQRQIQPMFL